MSQSPQPRPFDGPKTSPTQINGGPPSSPEQIGWGQWAALIAALLGWMFDGAEMGLFALVGRPAVMDLLGYAHLTGDQLKSVESSVGLWYGVVTAGFLVGAATGGVLFGWLGDRVGRVRAMTLSVLTYALFTGLCGVAGSAWQVGALRFIAALGMGGEWSLGVALVMELWPNRSRAFMAGLIGAAANVGFLLVGFIGLAVINNLGAFEQVLSDMGLPQDMVAKLVSNKGWRLLMIAGAAPALLTFLIRLFVPESEKWQDEHRRGSTSQWATKDLSAVILGALGPGLIIYVWATPQLALVRAGATGLGLLVAVAGYTFPVLRYLQRGVVAGGESNTSAVIIRMLLAASLSAVALVGTWGSVQWAATYADKLAVEGQNAKELVQIWVGVGAVIGTILAALSGDWLGRRFTWCLMCAASLGSVVLFYVFCTEFNHLFLAAATLMGACTASFYGWLPLYLPELFATRVRATAQGFSFNFGRIIAAIAALQTGNLIGVFDRDWNFGAITVAQGYPAACTTISLIYVVGLCLIWLLPETKGRPLPD